MSEQTDLSEYKDKLEWSLFFMRLGVFIVMFAWTVDKFTDPGHGAAILKGFYFIGGAGETLVMAMGVAAMIIAWITVITYSLKAAKTNPADALRYE